MEIRHLRAFLAIAEEMNVTRAAERLHISQPPLSRTLQQLEEELGVALFDRSRRRLRLTEAGTVFTTEAREVLGRLERAARTVQRAARGEFGHLALGFVETATASGVLPQAVSRFRAHHPGAEVALTELPSARQVEALLERTIDIGFAHAGPPTTEGLASRTVLVCEGVLAIAADNPLSRARRITLDSIAGEPLVLWERHLNPAWYDTVIAAFQLAGGQPRVIQHAVRWQTMVSLAAGGLGVALVPDAYAAMQFAGIVYRRIAELRLRVTLDLIWRANETSPLLEGFLRFATNSAREHSRGLRRLVR